jgi:hypothetical protein
VEDVDEEEDEEEGKDLHSLAWSVDQAVYS